jgi:hypothetical protein
MRPHDVRTRSGHDISPQDAVEPLGYFGKPQIFYHIEALASQQLQQLDGIEKTKPGLTPRRRPFGRCHDPGSALSGIVLEWLDIVENDGGLRHLGNELQCGRDCIFCQIRHYAKPLKKRRLVQFEPRSCQPFCEALSFKITGAKVSDGGSARPAALIRSRFQICVAG